MHDDCRNNPCTLRCTPACDAPSNRKALEALAASVPYADAIAAMVADPLKPTAASEAGKYVEDVSGLSEALLNGCVCVCVPSVVSINPSTSPLSPHTTWFNFPLFVPQRYSDDVLFRDARFKLGLALRDAGCASSAYAANVVAKMAPRARNPLEFC